MGTKTNPGAFDCYTKAEPDEPMFVLLGRDIWAPLVVTMWADMEEQKHGATNKVLEARNCAANMMTFYNKRNNIQ